MITLLITGKLNEGANTSDNEHSAGTESLKINEIPSGDMNGTEQYGPTEENGDPFTNSTPNVPDTPAPAMNPKKMTGTVVYFLHFVPCSIFKLITNFIMFQVNWFHEKGFGFIRCDDGAIGDVFCMRNNCWLTHPYRNPKVRSRVVCCIELVAFTLDSHSPSKMRHCNITNLVQEFEIQQTQKGPRAANVMGIGGGDCEGGRYHGTVQRWNGSTGSVEVDNPIQVYGMEYHSVQLDAHNLWISSELNEGDRVVCRILIIVF